LSRYHGAFEGFGVTSAFAWSSNGAFMTTERKKRVIVKSIAAMNSMNTRSGQTSTSSSRARACGRATGRATTVVAMLSLSCVKFEA